MGVVAAALAITFMVITMAGIKEGAAGRRPAGVARCRMMTAAFRRRSDRSPLDSSLFAGFEQRITVTSIIAALALVLGNACFQR